MMLTCNSQRNDVIVFLILHFNSIFAAISLHNEHFQSTGKMPNIRNEAILLFPSTEFLSVSFFISFDLCLTVYVLLQHIYIAYSLQPMTNCLAINKEDQVNSL